MMEPGIEVTAQMRADHKYQSLLLMKICVEGLNAMVDGFCFVFLSYIFVPDIPPSRIARVATSSTLADLTKSALVRHIKKKKILHLFRNNFYYDSHVLHLWWNTNNVKIYFKTETHYFRTTSMNLLSHLINDGAVKCLRSVLSDTE